MKKTLLLLFVVFSLSAFGQTYQYMGAPGTTVVNKGSFRVDSFLYLPNALPVSSILRSGALRYNTADSNLYSWSGTQWQPIATEAFVDTALGYVRGELYGLVNDGVTDNTAAFNAMIAAAVAARVKNIVIPEGDYFVTGTTDGAILVTTNGLRIMGRGYKTRIICTSNRAMLVNANDVSIENIRFTGSLADSANTGIYINNRQRIKVSGCWFENFGGRISNDGSAAAPVGGGGILVRSTQWSGCTITNNYFINDSVGLNLGNRAEYNNIANNHYYGCGTAIANWAGNNTFVNESINYGVHGFQLLPGTNMGHGTVTNLTVNHTSGRGISISGQTLGMQFIGAMVYYDSIVIANSTNIRFIGGDFGDSAKFLLDNNTNISMVNPNFPYPPTVTVVSGESLRIIAPPSVQTLTDGATITWDVVRGKTASVTLGATGRTLTITNAVSGDYYTIKVKQDGTGSRTITTWPTGTIWKGGVAPTLTTTAAAMDIISFMYDGTNFIGTYQLDNK